MEYTQEDIDNIQRICEECCDDYTVAINNQYIGEIFQWLINNDYVISKKSTIYPPEKRREIPYVPPTDREVLYEGVE